jgi:hypothetical protein
MLQNVTRIAKWLIVLWVCGYSLTLFAAAVPIGQVIWVKGNVQANQQNQPPRQLQRKSQIFLHDTIKTDAESSGQIVFLDSTMLAVRDKTELRMDEFTIKRDAPKQEKAVVSLLKGGFRTITGTISKDNPEGYHVNTPVATIGVRGTDYTVFFDVIKGLLAKIDIGAIVLANDSGEEELNKDMSRLYGKIDLGGKFELLASMPGIFLTQPTITPMTKSQVNSITNGNISGPVSSFCIG